MKPKSLYPLVNHDHFIIVSVLWLILHWDRNQRKISLIAAYQSSRIIGNGYEMKQKRRGKKKKKASFLVHQKQTKRQRTTRWSMLLIICFLFKVCVRRLSIRQTLMMTMPFNSPIFRNLSSSGEISKKHIDLILGYFPRCLWLFMIHRRFLSLLVIRYWRFFSFHNKKKKDN